MHSFFGSWDLMMEEDHQVEIKQLYNISFDKGKECQIPEKLVVEDRVVVQMSIAFLKSMVWILLAGIFLIWQDETGEKYLKLSATNFTINQLICGKADRNASLAGAQRCKSWRIWEMRSWRILLWKILMKLLQKGGEGWNVWWRCPWYHGLHALPEQKATDGRCDGEVGGQDALCCIQIPFARLLGRDNLQDIQKESCQGGQEGGLKDSELRKWWKKCACVCGPVMSCQHISLHGSNMLLWLKVTSPSGSNPIAWHCYALAFMAQTFCCLWYVSPIAQRLCLGHWLKWLMMLLPCHMKHISHQAIQSCCNTLAFRLKYIRNQCGLHWPQRPKHVCHFFWGQVAAMVVNSIFLCSNEAASGLAEGCK